MLAPVIPFARPEDRIRLSVSQEVASANKCLAQSKLVVSTGRNLTIDHRLRKGSVVRGVSGVCFEHDLRLDPSLVWVLSRVQPVVNEDELPISFRFVPQSVFRFCARCLKCDLLATFAIQPVSRAEISMKFESAHLPFQTLNFLVRLLQFVVRWLQCHLALILRSNLI